ncbi:hypothetical protein TBLA_0B07630 [Henningerozyma blattae CBS 6284]|uniref:Peptidyl-prolyl cis-trans isomerase n=1 Tax=Henningerozyma blattae (strain ATCC 34711 / CBS 6284 / DSM 70876 / NBRC 10599 / NRRL Y-10934 / UCD 77-7) TaxID=1071380 RepID=I2GZM7_HENB6|nr:hypothetical protein TBLA_0B07630 [Tetrapisispora blattae CBS 6284]CCH59579.1 hypothetical protein TBLA_0B07630 [Tetrapisispora blattae CBS 6284]
MEDKTATETTETTATATTTATSSTTNGLPEPWTIRYSRSKKREYYFNPSDKKSQWEAPEGTDEEALKNFFLENPIRVHCKHILIKHKDSRRPSSHRKETITITKEEAIKELTVIQESLKKDPTQFDKFAKERSDCSSFKRNGDLGWFGKGEMQPNFEKSAFSLKINEISDIVETDSGVHLILREA